MGDVYLDNVKQGIKRQIRWANINTEEAKHEFLDNIIAYCTKLKAQKIKYKKSKTRHG